MNCSTKEINLASHKKSGKPCDKLIALCSCANADITVKMVVPVFGSLDFIREGNAGISEKCGTVTSAPYAAQGLKQFAFDSTFGPQFLFC